MKKGDKVYRAYLGFGGVEVSESTVVGHHANHAKLATRESAWGCRVVVPWRHCHATRRDAIEALLAATKADMEYARQRHDEIATALALEPAQKEIA
jgi:ABC-type branched-subunit amino acid transport system ATPase component